MTAAKKMRGTGLWTGKAWLMAGFAMSVTAVTMWRSEMNFEARAALSMGYLCSIAAAHGVSKWIRDREFADDIRTGRTADGRRLDLDKSNPLSMPTRRLLNAVEGTVEWSLWSWGSFVAFSAATEWLIWHCDGISIDQRILLMTLHAFTFSESTTLAKCVRDAAEARYIAPEKDK